MSEQYVLRCVRFHYSNQGTVTQDYFLQMYILAAFSRRDEVSRHSIQGNQFHTPACLPPTCCSLYSPCFTPAPIKRFLFSPRHLVINVESSRFPKINSMDVGFLVYNEVFRMPRLICGASQYSYCLSTSHAHRTPQSSNIEKFPCVCQDGLERERVTGTRFALQVYFVYWVQG